MAILEENFGIDKAMMTTVHSFTASQRLQDAPAKDLREARNASTNIVPTTTGASIAAAKAMPSLEGIFGGLSVRVPTPVVSLADFAVITKKPVTKESINEAFKKAADDPYFQGIVAVTEEELVSSDFIGNSHSAIVDLKLTDVVGDNFLKVIAWYDNEWGYSNRLVELTADVAKLLENGDDEPKAESNTNEKVAETSSSSQPASEVASASTDSHKPEAMLEAPESAKEALLPKPESLEHNPDAGYIITNHSPFGSDLSKSDKPDHS
jgi:hypothetical protein